MNWKDVMKPEEVERYAGISVEIKGLRKEKSKIYDKCRKRLERVLQSNNT